MTHPWRYTVYVKNGDYDPHMKDRDVYKHSKS